MATSELMAIIKLIHYELMPYKIKLSTPWETASSCLHFRQGILVKLVDQHSHIAIGECAPMPEIGTESLSRAQQFLEQKLASLVGQALTDISLNDMDDYPASHFALESAYLSLLAHSQHLSFTQCLADLEGKHPQKLQPLSEHKRIRVNAMLGTLDFAVLTRVKQAEAEGFTCLKFKIGLTSLNNEIKQLKILLQQVSASTLIRLDANKSWSVSETEQLLDSLRAFSSQIDSIEEPLKHYSHNDYQKLQQQTTIPLALDESFDGQLTAYPLKRLVLKPMIQGSLVKTLMLARQAQKDKIEVVITSSIETAYGLWPISHLCALLDNQQYHGLATASWLEDTLIEPPEIKHGLITL
ncbi:o-succinylbenzoate synthase [sulfur-oxidizing endosymbiont of Gigantopelta aegis]|uniref:o-succinylbenzoate synthase n=1 Tax=sulfur-oxidizing endosymbiont of Gigantopelta aegis TaxID=2794934 RepID=UPI0018DC3D21|nr:o-succinylbenzoate synthase [sulfur-oxidizing endosymbiont of Gigantopelta aegis]